MSRRRALLASHFHSTTKGKPLDFDRYRYLAPIYADVSPDITLMTSAQIGKSEFMVVDAFALISLGVSYQLVQPKDDLRVLFSRTRIDEPVKRCKFYADRVISSGKVYKWHDPDLRSDGILRITFSNREDEMIAFPADAVGIDELDRCDLNNIALLPDRMLGSEYGLFRRASTPTTVGSDTVNNICYHFLQTDQLEYYVQCPRCRTWDWLDWFRLFVQEKRDEATGQLHGYELRDESWKESSGRDVYPICASCGGPMDRLAAGEYHPSKGARIGHRRGYHVSQLLSPLHQMRTLWADYQESVNNPTRMQRFSNSILGQAYHGAGSKLTEEMIRACLNPYVVSVEGDWCDGPCSMGIDVGREYLHVRISHRTDLYTFRMVYANRLRRFEDLHPLIDRFHVSCAVIDAEPEGRAALEFQRVARCTVYVCHTKEKLGMTLEDLDLAKQKPEKKMTIDRTVFMDAVLASFQNRHQIIPQNYRFLAEGTWIAEMLNPTRVLEVDDHNREKYVWTSGADHAFLATVYDWCAGRLMHWSMAAGAHVDGRRSPLMSVSPTEVENFMKAAY